MIGELGLAADVRPISGVPRRLAEAAGSGSITPSCPAVSARERPKGMRVDEASNLGDAFRSLGNDDGVVQWLRRGEGRGVADSEPAGTGCRHRRLGTARS